MPTATPPPNKYDANGNQTDVLDAEGDHTATTYDSAGRPLTVTDPDGRVTSYQYDALGHVLSTTDGANGVTMATYDGAGNRLTSTDPLTNVTHYGYDGRNLVVSVTDALGTVTKTEYDGNGNKTKVTDPLTHITTYGYDADNRLTSVTDPNGHTTSYVYDFAGNQTQMTDPLSQTTAYQYDALNRLTQVTDAMGGRAIYGYDAVGNGTAITDPDGITTHIHYDAVNRPDGETDPTTGSSSYIYDGVSNLLQKTDGNNTVTKYSYDKANRLKVATYPEGPVSFNYDGAGDRHSMTDQTGTTTYQYDGARRLTQNAAPGGTTAYTYDLAGNLKTLTYPDGNTVTYSYDPLNHLVGVTDWSGLTSGYSYDAAGRKSAASQPNGTRAIYTYDPGSRLTGVRWTGVNGAPVASFAYTYDAAGNRKAVTDLTGTSSFNYDKVNRLTQATYADSTNVGYQYDPAGNRTSVTTNGATTFYGYDQNNKLQSIGTDAVTWDGNGNMLSKGATTYVYDSQNRLLDAKTSDQTIQMAYDGADQRVTRSASGVATSYVYDDHSQLARVVKEGNSQRSQLYGLDGQVLWDNTSDQGQLYYHQDALGSTAAVTKPDGSVAATMFYDAFGAPRSPITIPGSFWFAGEQYDQDTSLIYLRARYYDPTTGRFLTADPAEPDYRNTQSLNPYAYAMNDPLRFVDPTGNLSLADIGAAVQRVGALDSDTGYQGTMILGQGALLACVAVSLGACAPFAVVADIAFTSIDVGVKVASAYDLEKQAEETGDQSKRVEAGAKLFEAGLDAASWGVGSKLADAQNTLSHEIGLGQTLGTTFAGPLTAWAVDGVTRMQGEGAPCCPKASPRQGPSSSPAMTGYGQPRGLGVSTSISNQLADGPRFVAMHGGAYVPAGNPPNKPTLTHPDNSSVTVGNAPVLRWQANGSPDNVPIVASQAYVYRPGSTDIVQQSGWIAGFSWQPQNLPYGTFNWGVQVRDNREVVSPLSDLRDFTVSSPNITFTNFSFDPASPSGAEQVAIHACTDGLAGLGITMRVRVNTANDGSANGTWNIIKELGVPCFDTGNGPPDHPVWQTLTYSDGPHLVMVEAHGTLQTWQ